MTIKGAKSKIKKFEIDTKSSTNVLPILKSILKELKNNLGEKNEKNSYGT